MTVWLLPWLSARAADEAGVAVPSEEVIVISEAVEQARAEVVREVESLGYTIRKEKDGRTVLRNEVPYKGKVVVFDDGRLETHRTGFRGRKVEPLPGTRVRPYFLCIVAPTYCLSAGSWYVAPEKWRATEDAVVDQTAAAMEVWSDRIAEAALVEKLEALPGRLEALWAEGAPLDGGPPLDTYAVRRAALLDFWDSRTDTVWGRQVQAQVESFVRAVVQASDEPYTDDEKALFEAHRRSARPFPWDPSTGDVGP